MSVKNLILTIVGHQAYIRHVADEKDYALQNNILFNSISQTYLPLINLFHKFEDEKVPFKLALVISPSLCSLLSDPVVQQQYIEWLERRIALGEKEIVRCRDNDLLFENAKLSFEKAKQDKIDFCEKYNQNLLKEFREFSKKGYLELLATCGTYAFLPHYGDMKEILNAQVETGLYSHRQYFGFNPDGFYLPYMGYVNGIEDVLRSYGFNYTIVDIRSTLFSNTIPKNGIFSPVRCAPTQETALSNTPIAVFSQDVDTPDDINAFASNTVYKDQERDVAYELSSEELVASNFLESGAIRIPAGYGYWSKAGEDKLYNYDKALAQLKTDAVAFVSSKVEKLKIAERCMDGANPSLLCVMDAKVLGQTWAEGVEWLESVIRKISESEVQLSDFSSLLDKKSSLEKIKLYPGAAQGNSYGEDLLDSTNGWMIRYTRKMSERMVDLSDRFPNETGLKVRLLNLGARELMLAQSGEWAHMIHDGVYPEYATQRFREAIKSFMIVFDALGSNTVSTEWLTNLEKEHTIFPWMNFRIFSKKQ